MRRRRRRPPVLPPWVPPGRILHLPGRGEVFFRHHQGGEPGAPTLLLLHGWTGSADLQWFTAYRALGERYPFVALDLRGHGRGLRSEVTFTLEDAADDGAALVRALGLGDVVAVGYSMGGPLSLLLAQRHPELVRGLVLVATAQEFHEGAQRARWLLLGLLESVLRSRTWRWLGRRALARLEARQPDLAPWLPWVAAELHRGDPTALTQAGRALRTFDARTFAPGLGQPAGVLVTTQDPLVPPERQVALAEALGAEQRAVHGDHFVCWGEPDAFAAALRELVDGVVSRAASPARSAG